MTEQEGISYTEKHGWSAARLGLDRARKLPEKPGNPRRQLKFIFNRKKGV